MTFIASDGWAYYSDATIDMIDELISATKLVPATDVYGTKVFLGPHTISMVREDSDSDQWDW